MTPELSRTVDVRQIGERPVLVEADAGEREAMAARFGLIAIRRLAAEVTLDPQGKAILASGRLRAGIVQACAVSGEPLTLAIDEPVALRFVPAVAPHRAEEEIELDADALDEIEFTGTAFDLGEAIAQTLALAIDPYAEGPEAERVRQEVGLGDESSSGPFAALLALKSKPATD